MALLLKGGFVVTVDEALGDLPGGDVLISDDAITAVGYGLTPPLPGTEIIDVAGRLVIPGLVDTHRHVWHGALGGHSPRTAGTGHEGMEPGWIAALYRPQDIYAGAIWGALQALHCGITTIADWAYLQSPQHADANLQGLQESGIRGYFLYGGPGVDVDDPEAHHAGVRRMRDEYFPAGINGRLRLGMALNGPSFTSAGQSAADFAAARALGLPISLHVGMPGTRYSVASLERSGLLGADVNYVHGNTLTDAELDAIAESSGTLSITPTTEMLMRFGAFPATGRAVQRGIAAGFGVDTVQSAGADLFAQLRLALSAERSGASTAAAPRATLAPAVDVGYRDMLKLATMGGAQAWHLQHETGSLTPGKQADVAIIDMRRAHLDGFGDPVTMMILAAGAADVETVIVGGEVVKRDGELVGPHISKARQLMRESREHLRAAESPVFA
jgi:cytosine/adenosine deaminase-related metal-dependent hydrolase